MLKKKEYRIGEPLLTRLIHLNAAFCLVCRVTFKVGDSVVSLEQGSKRFHKECYEKWSAGKVKLQPFFVPRGTPGKEL